MKKIKKYFNNYGYAIVITLIGILIILFGRYYSTLANKIMEILIYIVFVFCVIYALYNIVIKRIIRNNKIKKVSKKDLKILDDFKNYEFDQKLLKRYNLIEYYRFMKYLCNDFKKMNRKIPYSKIEMDNDYSYISSIKNNKIKDYYNKLILVNDVIFKYYDEDGVIKI